MAQESEDLAQAIREQVVEIVARSPFNRLDLLDNVPVVEEPLVGFADGYDSAIGQFKEAVGLGHRSPLEAWSEAFPRREPPSYLSVIAFVLPFSEEIRASNRDRTEPSSQWVQGKAYSDAIGIQVRNGLVAFLGERGYHAVAPVMAPTFHVDNEAPRGPVSNWSERHYCYVAGLGTFGLSRGLITGRGVAMRCGSVVADVGLPPSPRPASHTAYCTFLEAGGCGECMSRCPAGAITPQGKDNVVCRRHLRDVLGPLARRYMPEEVVRRTGAGRISDISACGLCQTGVPCENEIPPASLSQGAFASP